MATDILMPKWGLTMKEGKVSRWLKAEGDAVHKGEAIFEVETDKITNTVEASGDGVLFQIVVPAGETVAVKTVVGVLAAAGILAIEKMSLRLDEDHARAKRLAEGLAMIPGVRFDIGMPHTNMVFPTLDESVRMGSREFVQRLAEKGVRIGVTGDRKFRLVMHYWIDDSNVDFILSSVRELLLT